jgi:hypothetical protein
VGVTWPAHQQSCDGRRRDFPGSRCSRTAERDSPRFGGTRFARLRGTTSDRVGHRRFPQSTGPCGKQNRQYSGRSALGDGTCALLFDPSTIFARPVSLARSCPAAKRERAHGAPSAGCFFIPRLARREYHPLPTLPHQGPIKGEGSEEGHLARPRKSRLGITASEIPRTDEFKSRGFEIRQVPLRQAADHGGGWRLAHCLGDDVGVEGDQSTGPGSILWFSRMTASRSRSLP